MGQWQGSTQSNYFTNNQRPSFSFSDTTNPSSTASIPTSIPQQQQYDSTLMTQPPTNMSLTSNANASSIQYNELFDFDFLMQNDDNDGNSNSVFTGDAGLDLGFGTHHDWADGGNQQLPDLFGGFFFGGPQGDGGMEMPEGGYPTTDFDTRSNGNGNGNAWGGQE